MDDKAFTERVARLRKVAEVVESLPSEVRSQAFATLEPYVTDEAAATRAAKAKAKPAETEPEDGDDDTTREAFFKAHNHTDPADNVRLAAAYLSLDKNEKDTLKEALGLRNRSGHPGKYRPGVKKVSSFIEDVVSILF